MTDSAITIYTTGFCSYCLWAKDMLQNKKRHFDEIRIDLLAHEVENMVKRSGGVTSVPQIFIGDFHVGGYTDMVALDQRGELEPLFDCSVELASE